ncbi:RDD family protein [Microbacterium sp. 8M]|uniref:RDD family protein n=1 Tax=Microbacterium sp. 8M TaxID=2653153 RepID=UPI0012F2FBF6|nr:RDD family protein [Microbacterium sp. 8M]VXB41981.1 RDD family protein [Microbacterium sp. 8M]
MTTNPVGPIAPVSRRAIACAIDLAISAAILIVGYGVSAAVAMSAKSDTLTGLLAMMLLGLGVTFGLAAVWFVVSTFLQGTGASVGMRIMRLRVVRDGSEAPLGFGRALLRNIVFGLSTAIVVGYFTPLFDGSGRFQGWHDRAAGAIVRDVRGAAGVGPAASGTAGAPAAAPAPAAAGAPAARSLATVPGAAPANAVHPGAPAAPFVPTPQEAPPEASPTAPFAAGSSPAPAASFAPPASPAAPQGSPAAPASPAARQGSPTGHTLPNAPRAGAPVTGAPAEVDPHDATVLSPVARAAADAAHESAMITVVPGVSPSVPAPAAPVVSGPETVAPARPPVPGAPPATVADALAQTPVVQPAEDDDPEETRISIPGHRLQFVWDDGARATVSGRTLFGRNPAPEAGATVVVVRDETLSLSKTHFEAAAEAAGGWVMDRHSTNGMTIVRDGVRIACPPGERVRIRLGDAIEIGDRIVTVGGYA